ILRYIGLAIKSIDNNEPAKQKEYLENCRTGLMRMVQIISKLLEFSRNTYSFSELTTIENIVEDAVRSMEVIAPKVEIKTLRMNPGRICKVRGSNLFQVFCNLIKNAIDAMEALGALTISIRYTKDIVEIKFCDTGCGFDPDKAIAMFEPFYTTKAVGRGTGLGLAICRDLVEKYKGRITAYNNSGRGSTFTVTLPVAELGGDDTESADE
ncbi:MAG: HAMP domain-containing histidine kinase, partial [Anaerohalosphaera sp.]|nr:HAMP domain-containing histidine kinase [Anaerohalosphaera sp.]